MTSPATKIKYLLDQGNANVQNYYAFAGNDEHHRHFGVGRGLVQISVLVCLNTNLF